MKHRKQRKRWDGIITIPLWQVEADTILIAYIRLGRRLLVPLLRWRQFAALFFWCECNTDNALTRQINEMMFSLVEGELLAKPPVHCHVVGRLTFRIDLLEGLRGYEEPSPRFALELVSYVSGHPVEPRLASRAEWEALLWPFVAIALVAAVGYTLVRLRYP